MSARTILHFRTVSTDTYNVEVYSTVAAMLT